MPLTVEHLKNKLKRLIIQFHHNKNKLGNNSHIIAKRDPNRPLISMRVGVYADNEEQEQYYYDGELEDGQALSHQFDSFSADLSTVPEDGAYQVADQSLENSPENNETYNDENDVQLRLLEQQRNLEESIRDNIHYIEKESKPRSRFWHFGKKLTPTKLFTLDSKTKATESTDIMIISQSTNPLSQSTEAQPPNYPSPRSERRLENLQSNSGVSLDDPRTSSFSRKKYSYSQSNQSGGFDKEQKQCPCGVCERKSQRPAEPWKVIMNDISLQAALFSTGSKIPRVSPGIEQNIVADFTTSKHKQDEQQVRTYSNAPYIEDWLKFDAIAEDLATLTVANDENKILETDLLDLTSIETRTHETSQRLSISQLNKVVLSDNNNNITRPSTQYSKTSLISDLLEPDPYKGAETSPVYGGVFQDYNYSDDQLQNQSLESLDKNSLYIGQNTQPLSIRSGKKLRQII